MAVRSGMTQVVMFEMVLSGDKKGPGIKAEEKHVHKYRGVRKHDFSQE